jgi:hypothetical protein
MNNETVRYRGWLRDPANPARDLHLTGWDEGQQKAVVVDVEGRELRLSNDEIYAWFA